MIEVLTPTGRIVAGHPMVAQAVTDDKGVAKLQKDKVTPRVEYYLALAITKGGEQHWNQTEWGAKIYQAAQAGFPNGEFNAPTFAWKITDGDSQIPNKKGKKPFEREGWAGSWVLQLSTGLSIRCFHNGKFEAHEVIQNKAEIKRGDYAQVLIKAKDNAPSESPGVYLNPELVNLVGPGVEIVGENHVDAATAFGASVATMPAGAQVDPTRAATGMAPAPQAQPMTTPAAQAQPMATPTPTPAPQVQPAPDFLQPVVYMNGGNQYTKEQLEGFDWTPAQIAACPTL